MHRYETMKKNTELKLICKVADIIECLSENNQDLLLFKYQHNGSNDFIADLMMIQENEVELALNHVKLLIAASLVLKNGQPMGEDILKRAVTIVLHRQMDNMLEIDDELGGHVTKSFDIFMQVLEEKYERRMTEKENR